MQESDLTPFGEVLTGICKSFIKFRNEFGAVGNNCIYVPVLNNPHFYYKERREKFLLNDNFFSAVTKLQGHKSLATLSWNDFTYDNFLLRSRADIVVSTGLIFNAEEYSKLSAAFRNTKRTFFLEGDKSTELWDFFQSLKKGSKKL
jgi:hypothetical protein